jgi:hypothetical protein
MADELGPRRRGAPDNHGEPVHGAFVEARRYKERSLDLRRKNDRDLIAWQKAIIDDFGGIEHLDAFQASMLDRATECLIILKCMAEHVEQNGIVGGDGQLVPCLRNSFLAYHNSFRLTLQAIYERAGRKPKRLPSIEDIIDEHSRSNT